MGALRLNDPGFVYYLAYGWNHAHFDPPPVTNLCRLFWRCVLSLLVMWPLMALGFIIGFFVAARPALWRDECCVDDEPSVPGEVARCLGPFVQYTYWIKWPGGYNVWPILILWFVGMVWLIVGGTANQVEKLGPSGYVWGPLAAIWGPLLSLALIGLWKLGERCVAPWLLRYEVVRLLIAYVRAFKAKTCVTIVVGDDDEDGEVQP